ncbi:MAG: formate dehydrogenase accessory sulfurtransferase FdhD [Polyangiaceae bacterium]|nr:formate dehydrogenase accessory sulfurtransferase FdhD [Polyangiaceae bacterium]
MPAESSQDQERLVTAFKDGAGSSRVDRVAHEEPLEIQVQGASVAVVMRTPGHDEELALGFLVTERVVAAPNDVVSIRHCTTVDDPEAEGNIIRVVLRDGVELPLERLRRNTYATSSCGICGKATIEAALSHGPAIEGGLNVSPEVIYLLPDRLRTSQPTFTTTGGLHAAALFDDQAVIELSREDVGRHNAVDKVVGAALKVGIDPSARGLFVSGRVSFEIVQKAAAFGLPIVAGISAPTSLAVRYGEALGVTVIGFVRGRSMNVYAHPERIV